MDPGALDRPGKYHLGECEEILLSLPVSLCLKKSCAKLATIFHRQTFGAINQLFMGLWPTRKL